MHAGRLVAAKEHRAWQHIHRKEDMSIKQEHNQKSAEERMQQEAGAVHDERIAPQAPRGLEPGIPSSASSDASAGTGRIRHAAMAALAVLALAAACACGVFACTVGTQDPTPVEAGQQAGDDEGDNADANAAGADDSATGSSDATSNGNAGDKGATASKNAKGKKSPKGKSGKNAADESKATSSGSGSGNASSSQASGSGKANSGSSSGGSSKNNGGSSGSSSKSNSNSNASNKITVTMSIDGSRAGDQDSASAAARKISVKRGANVYDVLVASGVSIQGDSTYVRSISGLAEFQCGGGSGWMYSVDGVFPNVSCGKYQLKGGERIVWAYTLNLGEDVK